MPFSFLQIAAPAVTGRCLERSPSRLHKSDETPFCSGMTRAQEGGREGGGGGRHCSHKEVKTSHEGRMDGLKMKYTKVLERRDRNQRWREAEIAAS